MSVAGNAAAAVIITANNQVAAHTIAGANAPSGDNHNLIAGSVGTADLHAGAVTATQLSSEARAHKIDFATTDSGDTNKTLLTLDELTFSADCQIGGLTELKVSVVSSVAGDIEYSLVPYQGSSHGGGQPLVANTSATVEDAVVSTGALRETGQAVYRNAHRVITIMFAMVLVHDVTDSCQVTGTAQAAASK
jgi:hypothetical protein